MQTQAFLSILTLLTAAAIGIAQDGGSLRLAPLPKPLNFSKAAPQPLERLAPVISATGRFQLTPASPNTLSGEKPLAPVISREQYLPPNPSTSAKSRSAAAWWHPVANWASSTYGRNYRGYYVGGGAKPGNLAKARPLNRAEGTFGVDYNPWFMRVELWRSHHLNQGGRGQYEPDRKNWPFDLTYLR